MTPAVRDPSLMGELQEDTEETVEIEKAVHAELSELLDKSRERFPLACRSLLHQLEGNRYCVDCNALDPEWAAVSYGALVCIRCSGIHRSMGVAVSQVRSVSMDHWTHKEVVLMLEGGNAQLQGFFARHALTKERFENQRRSSLTADNVTALRYKTKAALFYKSQLDAHVDRLLQDKPYKGRSRRPSHRES